MKKDEVLRVIEEAARNEQTKLNLSGNQLKILPAEIVDLKNLTWLFLSKNQLKTLPAEIGKLKNLTLLNLSDNQLTSLPAEIVELTNLTSLDLSGNQLKTLPGGGSEANEPNQAFPIRESTEDFAGGDRTAKKPYRA